MATEADILKALENLYGPGGAPLSGAVSGATLSGSKAFVSLAGDPAQAQAWEAARVAAERAVKAIPGVEAAVVTLTAERAPGAPKPAAQGQNQGHQHAHHHGPAQETRRRAPRSVAVWRRRWRRSVS